MTKVVVLRKGDRIISLEVEGHSGYAPSGKDIVCSSVTTLVQVLHTGITDVLGIKTESIIDERDARIRISWDDSSSEAQAIASTVCESFRALAETYPKNVKLVEVQENAL